ncbi:hypothetical protein [Armatimonas sp.]|uniref:hypothetical protein n=1 Tax=Armatimonas sp. TaxID=1872638 RepID=UPI00286B79B9|nr:hypothetical protein [Armatimonas sp.]
MQSRQATVYGSPLLVEGVAAVLKNLTWFDSVRMVDPEQTSLEELQRFSADLLVYFPEGVASSEIRHFSRYIIISGLPQEETLLVVLSPFDSVKTIRVGILSALSGQYYRSPRLRQPKGG